MNNNQIEILKQCAKGDWQRGIVENFIKYQIIKNPIYYLQGSAKNYSSKYTQSFNSLLKRIENCGFQIERIPGNKGGWYSSTFKIKY